MSQPDRSSVIRFADAKARIPSPESDHAVSLLERGTLKVKLSIPVRPTVQTPHTQDELYFVVRGRGVLVHDGKRDPSRQAICYLSPQGRNTKSKLSLTWLCGLFSTAKKVVRSLCRARVSSGRTYGTSVC